MTKTLEVSDEIYEKIKDQLGEDTVEINAISDMVGKKVFLRTVTYHLLGEVKKVVGELIFLKNASWIADSKRFGEAIKNGFTPEAEIEYLGEWFVNKASLTDGGFWKHSLPTKSQ